MCYAGGDPWWERDDGEECKVGVCVAAYSIRSSEGSVTNGMVPDWCTGIK